MSVNRVQLNKTEILEKEFKTAMRGYNQEEVDEFLDVVIQDYEFFQKEIEKLKQENEKLKKQYTEPPKKQPANPQVNYDILKRISNLEKAVFGSKFAKIES
ncbi:cell division regulator GpsB [Ornithinibacillus halophilus]|uniref:DivIVA domain-containing protein n=1 Tax=Ornithinibacillus halophilus TaxID=930117 RepID=A0A1M5CMB1_9BACI|nr:cell division regulator GpsB [Ornithinibacillus halophilus]SHF55727.1 DivIVA domain-containing protein [Ornithinibacillus halophilus]